MTRKDLREHQVRSVDLLRQSLARKEDWAAIPGHEGAYEASTHGRIRSVDRIVEQATRWGGVSARQIPGIVLAQTLQQPSPGYFRQTVKLSNGKAKTRLVHQLVMEAFVGPRPNGMEVAHGDGDSLNNCLSNLRYVTAAENTGDKRKHGTVVRGERVTGAKLTEAQAVEIIGLKGKRLLRELAAEFGVAQSCISRIQTGVRWGHLQ